MIALSMIVKGTENPDMVLRAINSVRDHIDAAYITITTEDESGLEKALSKVATVDIKTDFRRTPTKKEIKWLTKYLGDSPSLDTSKTVFQFDKARNHAMSQIPKKYDWVLWLDADDVFRRPELIKQAIADAESKKAECIFMNYLYQVEIDKQGNIENVVIEHLRERLVKNNGAFKWIAPIHETLVEQRGTIKTEFSACDVVHLSEDDRRQTAIDRNILALEFSIYDTQGKDPRPVYYLAKSYYDKREDRLFSLAENLFKEYLDGEYPSGWAEERAQCCGYLCEVYRMRGDMQESIRWGMRSLNESEKFPANYFSLAMTYLLNKEWEKALHWVAIGLGLKQPKSTLITNPKEDMLRALEIIYHACLNTNQIDRAYNAALKQKGLLPDDEHKNRINLTEAVIRERDLTKNTVDLVRHLLNTNQGNKIKPLIQSLPAEIANNPIIVDLKKKFLPPRVWESNEIALYCGPGFTPWSPKKLDNPGESFLGGSEEAVIYLGRELAKQGWKVTVFGEPGIDEGEYDGVTYKQHFEFNLDDEFNIVIAWRNAEFFKYPVKSKKNYVWCHDIQNSLIYTDELLEKIDKVIVLSKWHRENIANVPDEKIMISKNGIDL